MVVRAPAVRLPWTAGGAALGLHLHHIYCLAKDILKSEADHLSTYSAMVDEGVMG